MIYYGQPTIWSDKVEERSSAPVNRREGRRACPLNRNGSGRG